MLGADTVGASKLIDVAATLVGNTTQGAGARGTLGPPYVPSSYPRNSPLNNAFA